MAIPSPTNRNDYLGSNATGTYAYSFRILLESHLRLTVRSPANVETTLILTTDYTVSGVLAASGGNITLVNSGQAWLNGANLASGWSLTIRRVLPLTQLTDIRNQGDFFPETHEDEFDRGVMVAQQQQDELDRSVTLPETIASSSFDPTLPATIMDTAGVALIVNTGKNGFSLGASASAIDLARIFAVDTFANLKATAALAPTLPRFGIATDLVAFVIYTGNTAIGDGGWIVSAGAGTPPAGGGLI